MRREKLEIAIGFFEGEVLGLLEKGLGCTLA